MRDLTLLAATLRTVRSGGMATRAARGSPEAAWVVGSTPSNGQAVQALIEDGWIKREGEGSRLVIDVWPSFAGDDPAAGAQAVSVNGLTAPAYSAWRGDAA